MHQNPSCAPDVLIAHQRTVHGIVDGAFQSVLSGSSATSNHGSAHVLHDRLHVGEIDVDVAHPIQQIRDPLDGVDEDRIHHVERLQQTGRLS